MGNKSVFFFGSQLRMSFADLVAVLPDLGATGIYILFPPGILLVYFQFNANFSTSFEKV